MSQVGVRFFKIQFLEDVVREFRKKNMLQYIKNCTKVATMTFLLSMKSFSKTLLHPDSKKYFRW